MADDQAAVPPLLEEAGSDDCVHEFGVEGGRRLLCTVRRHPEQTPDDPDTLQVLFSFKESFFGPHETGKELFLHWGVASNPGEWRPPSKELLEHLRFNGQKLISGESTPKIPFASPSSSPPPVLELSCPVDAAPDFLVFVLHSPPNGWFKQQNHGGPPSNFVLPLKKSLSQVLSKGQFLKAVSAFKAEQPLHSVKPSSANYWRIDVNEGDMQLLLLTFANRDACAVEVFCNWPAALLLHWGTAEGPGASWKRMELNKMLVYVSNSDSNGSTSSGSQQEGRGSKGKQRQDKDAKRLMNGTHASAEENADTDETDGEQQLEVVYGTFAHYPIDDKAAQTVFEFCESHHRVGFQRVALCFRGDAVPAGISFVLKEVKADRWFSSKSGDFFVRLPTHPYWETLRAKYRKIAELRAAEEEREKQERIKKWNDAKSAFEKLVNEQNTETALNMRRVPLSDGVGELLVRTEADDSKQSIRINLTACLKTPCVLRWGMVDIMGRKQTEVQAAAAANGVAPPTPSTGKGGRYQWICPPPETRPPHTVVADPQRGDNRDFVEKIVEAEVEWQHMTLMHRYNLMREFYEAFARKSDARMQSSSDYSTRAHLESELVKAWPRRQWEGDETPLPESFAPSMEKAKAVHEAVACDELAKTEAAEETEFWELMFTWARFAFLGLLDWQRNYNTKPRELAHACESLTFFTVKLWRLHPSHRPLIRGCLSTMGRGGSQGQAIRDRILEIMHKHHIPEHGSFYEQWHQKLHNNTTPDDIGICRAIIAYLETRGDMSTFWRVLSEHNITRERLASYERKITMEPYVIQTDLNELINDFRAYLSVIQDVHDARDARVCSK
ncbi:hypothetical protein Emag_000780 [Eimeria magna]